ncbi:MAG: recombinase family protein [Chloroflexi bacterium]|nr:recombinase family protein [Chloroflexota bacterium]
MKRCVLYARVSTDVQERDGTSLDTQERAGLEFAASQGFTVVRTIRDAASGYHLDREGIESLRVMLRGGEVDVVVAYAVDRLSRNQNHIGVLFDEIQQADAKLEFVTERFEDTAVGRFILAARAFIAEVEREKIIERTMRGKAERARSGRLPQGVGRGIYGYQYHPETGHRSVDAVQAGTVLRIFGAFDDGLSCNRIANDLNRDGVPAFGGGCWYPLTVRRVLLNETYTGRTIYRRTRADKVRDVARNKWRRRVVVRDESEWIEIEGATPLIVSLALFERVRVRLADPERVARVSRSHRYALSGRLRCAECGAAMVGHAVNGGRYLYYRCPRGSSGPGTTTCGSRYVRTDRLEAAVKAALADVLASPDRILDEARRLAEQEIPVDSRLDSVLAELNEVEARQRRLVQLFTRGDLPEDMLSAESKVLAERRGVLEAQRRSLDVPRSAQSIDPARIARDLPRALRLIRAWVDEADGADFDLVLRALNAQIVASNEAIEVRGEVPLIVEAPQSFATIERTSA